MHDRRILFYIVASLLVGTVSSMSAGQGGDDSLVPPGFVSLFNGQDLTGWKIPEGDGGHWRVVDGVIDYDARSEAKGDKCLWTQREFGDFILQLDWRIKPEALPMRTVPYVLPDGSHARDPQGKPIEVPVATADSGIYLRGSSKSQINIWNWPIGSGEVYGYRTDQKQPPDVRAGVTPHTQADKPLGQWNRFEIKMRGDRLTVVLNGHTVIDKARLPGVPAKGPIALQHHGGFGNNKYRPSSSVVQFRNIFMKQLPGCDEQMLGGKTNCPVKLIFDTDMGNDIDDALALGVIHALQSRGECELLAVTISKDNAFSAPYVDLVNTFYGRGDIQIGVVRNGKTPEDSKFTRPVAEAMDAGRQRYPHDLLHGKEAPEAVSLLRKILAAQPDQSVVIVVVGFSTNPARLLESGPDEHSSMTGLELVTRKCRLLSNMAGIFQPGDKHREYNVVEDLTSAQKLFADWPGPIVTSGFEIGRAITYPAVSIEKDFNYVTHHPLAEGYRAYMKMPYDRPTWDLTSVLFAVRPDRGYFNLSERGTITVDEQGHTTHTRCLDGNHRYLRVNDDQIVRVREALVQLASQPPLR